jgi:hypothetical protein
MFPHRILADMEAQEIQAYLSVVRFEGVADAGFFRVQFQAVPANHSTAADWRW